MSQREEGWFVSLPQTLWVDVICAVLHKRLRTLTAACGDHHHPHCALNMLQEGRSYVKARGGRVSAAVTAVPEGEVQGQV